MEVGGGGARGGAFGTKVEAGLQPAGEPPPLTYGFAIGYYEAAPSALRGTLRFNTDSTLGRCGLRKILEQMRVGTF
jgi:hypothetical protein